MNCGTCNTEGKSCGPCGSQSEQTKKHPCYSADAHHKYARMHLPVAPKCNISCNYCNRKFDCVNESRPGVTSEVLTPEEALNKFLLVKQKLPNLSVVGIAGPGDALANWDSTKKTLEQIKASQEDVVFCLSTNGLMLPDYAQELIDLGVNHITVTMNCLDPQIGAQIYKSVNYKGKKYTGVEAATVLMENQLAGIAYLTARGVLVKINIVMIKGINDQHIPQVVKKAKELGCFVTNIMPLIPAPGSVFEQFPQTSTKELNQMRDLCQIDMHQMRHCKQCRADAIGMLGEDLSHEFRGKGKQGAFEGSEELGYPRYKVAVASKYGKLVDLHFGHATEFRIYITDGKTYQIIENRAVEKYCAGVEECQEEENRRENIFQAIKDCDAVLSMRIGYSAKENLSKRGIISVESCDTVEDGLVTVVETIQKKDIA